VDITVNGQSRQIAEETTITQLLGQLSLSTPHVAVEVNLQVVPRQRHAEHRLAQGDRVVIVTFVGGG
jgi:sulfur carrier protein